MTDAATTTATEAGGSTAAPAQAPAATAATTATLLTGAPATTTTATDANAAAAPAPGTPEAEAAAKAKAEADAKATGAPETYADFKFAEGIEVKPEQVTEFATLAKSYNLTQAQAQGLIDYQTKLQAAASEGMETARLEMEAGWRKSTESDKEFGGANLQANIALASKALQQFGTPELTKFFTQDTRLGDHPEVLRFFARVGKALGEDTHIQGGVTATPKSMAQRWYGDTMPPPPKN